MTGKVVAAGTMIKGLPFMMVVLPDSPSGAPARGTVVGPGMMKPCSGPAGRVVAPGRIRNELPSITVVLP
jgi:hypothetical protein